MTGCARPNSPLKNQRSLKKGEEKRAAEPGPDANSSPLKPAGKGSLGPGSDEIATSPTSDRAGVAKKRFTLQGFSNLKPQRGTCGVFSRPDLTVFSSMQ